MKQLLLLGILSILSFNFKAQDKTLKAYKIPEFENKEYFGTKIPRTMSLLENSTKHIPRDLKIQFYGQSIVGGLDQNLIINKLKERYPTVTFNVVKNPIGGFTAPSLSRVAIHDLYHEYADLIIFHVYGGDKSGDLEEIFRNIKSRTTAEVIVFNHHIVYAGENENTQQKRNLSDFYGSKSIELLANKYDFEFVDIRKPWKDFISINPEINIKSLLRDGVHPNKLGNELLAYCILQHFKYNPYLQFINSNIYDIQFNDITYQQSQYELKFKGDYDLSDNLKLGKDSELSFNFVGNRVDIIPTSENKNSEIEILVNSLKPSEISSLFYITRPSSNFEMWWPAMKRVSLSEKILPIIQKYTLEIFNINRESKTFSFKLFGKKSNVDYSQDIYLVDIFFMVDTIIEDGIFKDKYFSGLYKLLKKYSKSYAFLPRLYGVGKNPIKFLRLLNILNHDKENTYLLQYELLAFPVIVKILSFILNFLLLSM